MKILTFDEICEICRHRRGKNCMWRTLPTLAAENTCSIIHRFKDYDREEQCKDCRDS